MEQSRDLQREEQQSDRADQVRARSVPSRGEKQLADQCTAEELLVDQCRGELSSGALEQSRNRELGSASV